ncbi:putative LRR receptor-like serine/threonine-protein kinase MRH1 [Triticum urartu]|uniref:Putative LRR receptor-like serine/threonine-protein kinase MRH1 n=1 Tax=Triticum urartu TaxID=4572 RepID=M7ZZ74_TRIUA|nr:putative LRR receptor-like serine/threonine-protein kinase MRH1 [Triticum urartu]
MGAARRGLMLLFVLVLLLQAQAWAGAAPLNGEGLALLELRARVEGDPHGVFHDWDPTDNNPCSWSGVQCSDGNVEILNLTGHELAGTLAPEIGSLQRLRSLLLPKNNFHGQIPREFGGLSALEVLDLSANNLDGTIPKELGTMPLLKQLSLHNNQFQEGVSSFNTQDGAAEQTCCLSRKLGCWLGSKNWISFNVLRGKYCNNLPSFTESHIMQNLQSIASAMRRRLLGEAGNLPALSGNNNLENSTGIQRPADVLSLGTGSFPAFPKSDGQILMPSVPESIENVDAATPKQVPAEVTQSPDKESSAQDACASIIFVEMPLPPGVPKLNRLELEAACEDFSNILNALPFCTVFKGTLSSGVEICVVSTAIPSTKEWSKSSETFFRKKIDTLSRVNHKNFVNLLGFCIENKPFMRMMVYEYAPNGTLSEHLHLKVFEDLDWAARMRIIMGLAYCLQYMHHELDPPVAINDIRSDAIFMTDDYAAKKSRTEQTPQSRTAAVAPSLLPISRPASSASARLCWRSYPESFLNNQMAMNGEGENPEKRAGSSRSEPPPDLAASVFCFGTLVLEIISGKLPEQPNGHEPTCIWAAEHLKAKNYAELVDTVLEEHRANELEAVCEVIEGCTDPDPTRRPAMRDVTAKLREVLGISPEAAAPRLSPLWWAELELLSIKST